MKYIISLLGSLVLLLLVITSCRYDSEADYYLRVDVESALKRDVSVYDIFSKVELVSLDNSHPISNHVYVGSANLAYCNQKFYILDAITYGINVYDIRGNYLCSSCKLGRGPGEYTMAAQIAHNQELDMIEVLSPMCKIMRYTSDSLRYVSQVDFSSEELLASHNFCFNSTGYLIYSASEDNQVWMLDKVSHKLSCCDFIMPKYLRNYLTPQSPFLELDGQICIFRTYDGLVYQLIDGSLKPIIEWDFGDKTCDLNDIPKGLSCREYRNVIIRNSKTCLSPFIDVKAVGKKIFANVVFGGGKTYTLYYDLDTSEYYFFDKTREGMNFLTGLFVGDCMYKYVDSATLPDYLNKGILDSKSQKAYDDVINGEGSAILVYHLK